jgi:hypothetical protein
MRRDSRLDSLRSLHSAGVRGLERHRRFPDADRAAFLDRPRVVQKEANTVSTWVLPPPGRPDSPLLGAGEWAGRGMNERRARR